MVPLLNLAPTMNLSSFSDAVLNLKSATFAKHAHAVQLPWPQCECTMFVPHCPPTQARP